MDETHHGHAILSCAHGYFIDVCLSTSLQYSGAGALRGRKDGHFEEQGGMGGSQHTLDIAARWKTAPAADTAFLQSEMFRMSPWRCMTSKGG